MGCLSVLEMLRQITPDVHIVKGDMDTSGMMGPSGNDFPEHEVVEIGCFRIGLLHGQMG